VGGAEYPFAGLTAEARDLLAQFLEACAPNKSGPGHHDTDTGHPCSPGAGAAATSGAQARKKAAAHRDDAPREMSFDTAPETPQGEPKTGIARTVWAAIKGLGSKIGGAVGRLEHAVKLRLAHALDSLETHGALAGAALGGETGAKIGAAAGRGLAGFLRGSMNLYFSTYFLASEAVSQVGKALGKPQAQVDKVSGLFTGADLIGAKGEVLAGEMAELSGQAILGVSMVPIASVAYLMWSARPKSKGGLGPVGVLRACAKAVGPVMDKILHPNKYRATATTHEAIGGQSGASPEQVQAVFDRLDEFGDDDATREWWWALLHVALDYAKGDVALAMKAADQALLENPEPPTAEDVAPGDKEEEGTMGGVESVETLAGRLSRLEALLEASPEPGLSVAEAREGSGFFPRRRAPGRVATGPVRKTC
jgi:hypothetical protein